MITDALVAREIILRELYLSFFNQGGKEAIEEIRDAFEIDPAIFEEQIIELEHQSCFIKCRGGYRRYWLTEDGIDFCEQNSLISFPLIDRNKTLRTRIIEELYRYFLKKPHSFLMYYELMPQLEKDDELAIGNVRYLVWKGILDDDYQPLRLTNHGLKYGKMVVAMRSLVSKYDEIKKYEPARRGHALEEVIASIAMRGAWEAQTRVITPGDEVDIVLKKGETIIPIEVKWTSEKIGKASLGEFECKMNDHAAGLGMFFSISGFSTHCFRKVIDLLQTRTLLLLYGETDIETLLSGRADWDDMMNEKLAALRTNRQVLVNGTLVTP